jgi:predicted DNA-binding transcriptional regulator AlpA
MTTKPKRYLNATQVALRYGKSANNLWAWRQRKIDPTFPKPVIINGRPHFEEGELDAYDEAHRAPVPDGEAA